MCSDISRKTDSLPSLDNIGPEDLPRLIDRIRTLEEEVSDLRDLNEHLSLLVGRRPPTERRGELETARWHVVADVKKNRIVMTLSGYFDYRAAKAMASAVSGVLIHARTDFDLIHDMRELSGVSGKRTFFHFKRLAFTMNYMKIRNVVRVLHPDQRVFSGILTHAVGSFYMRPGFEFLHAGTLEEAHAMLDARASIP